MNNEWFVIKNLEEFVNASRRLVFQSFGNKIEDQQAIEDMITNISKQEQQELDNILSYDESYLLIKPMLKKQINKKTKDVRFILSEDLYMSIIEALNDRLVSNVLNSLVNKGLIETAYDDKSNDFIFWIKDEHKNSQKPNAD